MSHPTATNARTAAPSNCGTGFQPVNLPAPNSRSATLSNRRLHRLLVPALLALTAVLACTSLVTDSVTFDETFHLTAGMSYLETHDFRLSPDHPPLARMWAAWPLLFTDYRWPPADNHDWLEADASPFSVHWLFELNDGQRFVVTGRFMIVILLLGTCLTVYALARTLFGPAAGLLALTLAALSPTLLAHGRLITTDLPLTFCNTLALLVCARLFQRVTWWRLLAAALTLTAASVTKFSWPLILPALAAMAALAILGPRPIEAPAGRHSTGDSPGKPLRRRERAALVAGAALFVGVVMWLGIWTCYQWRSTIIAPIPTGDNTPAAREQLRRAEESIDHDWQIALHHKDGTPQTGLVAGFVRLAAATRVLPDGYIFGLARTMHFTGERCAYLMGQYSDTGWRSYFPIAFAIKTPVPTMLLLVAGIVALLARRARPRDLVMLAGLLTFAALYAAYMIKSNLNIGHRHLLPLYPILFVLAGAAAAWLTTSAGRWLIGAALVWLLAANLWIHPHYLSYFNELIGGPACGHLYLADSNIDWGQDLLRLARYSREHPDEQIKLSFFGSAVPTRYLKCSSLPSFYDFEPCAELTAGTYVVSVTQLLGVYDDVLRDEFWTPEWRQTYADFGATVVGKPPPPDETPEMRQMREGTLEQYEVLRRKRLLNRLGHRRPDERIGYSMFVYRLTGADVEQLTRP